MAETIRNGDGREYEGDGIISIGRLSATLTSVQRFNVIQRKKRCMHKQDGEQENISKYTVQTVVQVGTEIYIFVHNSCQTDAIVNKHAIQYRFVDFCLLEMLSQSLI